MNCSKMKIAFGEVTISSVSYSQSNSVGSQIQHPTGDDKIISHKNRDVNGYPSFHSGKSKSMQKELGVTSGKRRFCKR